MDEQNRSGNRWEPEAQQTQPVQAQDPAVARRPLVLGIAAAVLLLVVGIGCFAFGRATAPDGFRGFDGDGNGFPQRPDDSQS